jgi:hypothetical protein
MARRGATPPMVSASTWPTDAPCVTAPSGRADVEPVRISHPTPCLMKHSPGSCAGRPMQCLPIRRSFYRTRNTEQDAPTTTRLFGLYVAGPVCSVTISREDGARVTERRRCGLHVPLHPGARFPDAARRALAAPKRFQTTEPEPRRFRKRRVLRTRRHSPARRAPEPCNELPPPHP